MRPPSRLILGYSVLVSIPGFVIPVFGSFISAPLIVIALPFLAWCYRDDDEAVSQKGKIGLAICGVSILMQGLWWLFEIVVD